MNNFVLNSPRARILEPLFHDETLNLPIATRRFPLTTLNTFAKDPTVTTIDASSLPIICSISRDGFRIGT